MREDAVFLNGLIDEGMYQKVISEYRAALRTSTSKQPIDLYINSTGGDTYAGLGLYDLFAASRRAVRGIVHGRAQSMAAIVLQACKTRCISKHSNIMLHLQTVSVKANVIDARATLDEFARLDQIMIAIIATRTGRLSEEIQRLMAQDAHFDAREAHEFGLVDCVV